jgi:two-component system, chemotaxis family, protein-glutamate methylesterase/glutaminase
MVLAATMGASRRITDMQPDSSAGLTGYICPDCGGALSKRDGTNGTQGDGQAKYRCRIGHAFTAAQLWIETCAMRNRALGAAARSVAETVDLARTLATEARTDGNEALAARLEAEALSEERYVGLLLEMLEDLVTDEPGPLP